MGELLNDAINNLSQLTAIEAALKSGFILFNRIVLNNKTWDYIYNKFYTKSKDDRISEPHYFYGQPVLIDRYLEDGRMVFCQNNDIIFSIRINMQD